VPKNFVVRKEDNVIKAIRAKLFLILTGVMAIVGLVAAPVPSQSNLIGNASAALAAQTPTPTKDKIEPLFREYKGVSISMTADEVRKKLGDPKDKSDTQDFYEFSDTETAQVYYDEGKVMAVSVIYLRLADAPTPKKILGIDIEPKADGSLYKLVRYPAAGYWVSYSRTAGDDPLITISMKTYH
jgi:hypothetical protein